MPDWLSSPAFWIVSSAMSVLLFVGTLVAIPVLCVRLPADYFVRPEPRRPLWKVVLRTIVAVVLLTMGVAMLVLPGQGVLTILVGLSILDFRAKRKLVRALLQRRTVLRAMNGMRRRASKPPLIMP